MLSVPWFYLLPIAVIWAGIVAILGLCAILGRKMGGRAKRRWASSFKNSPENVPEKVSKKFSEKFSEKFEDTPQLIASSILGLLALILGFTFSLASSRFEGRRQLVIDEANAISTTYYRTTLLRGPEAREIRLLLRKYLDTRIAFYQAPATEAGYQAARQSVSAAQEEIWRRVIQASKVDRGAIESIFINSVNLMFDLENTRSFSLIKSLPEVIYWVILIIAGTGLFALEYTRGVRGESGYGWTALLVSALSCVIVMILDLDRPRAGLIRVSQDALISLRSSIAKSLPNTDKEE